MTVMAHKPKHFFLEYNNVTHIWIHFQIWWKEITGNEIILDYKSIVFGVNEHNPDLLLDLCIIIIKRMIYGR